MCLRIWGNIKMADATVAHKSNYPATSKTVRVNTAKGREPLLIYKLDWSG